MKSLQTDHLIALPLCKEDLPYLCQMHQDPDVMATMGGVRSEAATMLWLRDNLDHWELHGFGIWMFRQRPGGEFVGRCGLRRVDIDGSSEVELAYALVAKFWGKGLAQEMATAVLATGFEALRLERVIALIGAENRASRRLAEKLGFCFAGNTEWKSEQAMLYQLMRRDGIKT